MCERTLTSRLVVFKEQITRQILDVQNQIDRQSEKFGNCGQQWLKTHKSVCLSKEKPGQICGNQNHFVQLCQKTQTTNFVLCTSVTSI